MLRRLALPIAMLLLASGSASAARLDLIGDVTYRERIALPPGATLTIELVDLALPDRPRLSVTAPTGSGQVPLAFTFSIEDSLILPLHDYALNAEIAAEGFRMRNAEPVPVTPLAQTAPVHILVQRVAEAEDSAGEPADPAEPALLNFTWRATIIRDKPVAADAGVTLLVGSDMRAGGNGGCNSYFSQAQIGAESFAIGNVGATMRSCGYELNMLEQGFFEALRAATRWRIDNGLLVLLDGAGNILVQFSRSPA